jgi:hypothetical protein
MSIFDFRLQEIKRNAERNLAIHDPAFRDFSSNRNSAADRKLSLEWSDRFSPSGLLTPYNKVRSFSSNADSKSA